MFDFSGMNENQIQAVEASDGPVLIIAGPGTGKTFTLVKRIAYLVSEKNVKPSEIMAVTFTEKAARELLTRISNEFTALGIDENINDMYIGTFHSIALRIMKELPDCKENNRRILDSFETTYLICRNISRFKYLRGFEEHFPDSMGVWKQSMAVCRYVSRLLEELADIDAMSRSEDNDAVLLAKLVIRYRELLEENSAMDFSSILTSLYYSLKENPDDLRYLNERIRYIMVDEYQDTNYIQEQLVFMLGGESRNICVVGDDDQGLYRFRGATIRNILEFPKKFDEGCCRQIYLDINYRSEPGIIDFCEKWMDEPEEGVPFSWDKFRYKKKLRSGRTNCQMNHSVFRCRAEDDTLPHALLETIYRLYDGGYISDFNQIAFLFSSVKSPQATELAEYFEANGIHVYSPRSEMFFERTEIKQILGCLIMCFGNYFADLKKNSFVHKISDKLRNYYRSCVTEAMVLLRTDNELHRYISAEFESMRCAGKDSEKTLLDILYKILSFEPFRTYLSAAPDDIVTITRAARNLSEISRMISRFSNMHNMHFITEKTVNNLPEQFFNVFIRFYYTDGIGEYEDISEYAPHGCISFMTIHQAKGLEFPVTIVGSLDKKPYRKPDPLMLTAELRYFERKAFEPLEDIRFFDFHRLFYTAFSRAQDLLILIDVNKKTSYFSEYTKMLPDISGFADGDIVFSPVKKASFKRVYSYTSHISLYDGCPTQYKFYKEYAFAQHKMMHTSIGSLVHATLEDINKSAIEGNAHRICEDMIRRWFVTNYRSMEEKTGYHLDDSQLDNALGHILRYYGNRKNELWKVFTQVFLSDNEDGKFVVELTYKLISGETITAEFLQGAKSRATKDPIYLHLCRKGQEDCLAYVKKSIMRFAKDAIDRNCIAELKEFESYGFITKSNAGKLAEYALEKENQNSSTVVCLLEIMDRTSGFKLEQFDKFLEKAQGNVEITAWLLECKNKHFTVDEIDKIETEKMEKELGLKERTLAEWKKIFTLDDDGSGGFKITGYKGEETQIVIPDVIAKKNVTSIEEYAFSPEKERLVKKVKDIRGKITSVFIPDTVTSIGDCAFYKCSSLTSITIPDSVTSIGDGAFEGTKWLKKYPDDFVIVNGILISYKGNENNVIIPDTVTSISGGAFSCCSRLKSVTIPDSVTSIGSWAFNNCSSLTSITIPDSVISIGRSAFFWCSSLTSITIPDSVTSIGEDAFYDCSKLAGITISNSVTSIGRSAFSGCRKLTSITIPDSVTSIGAGAFIDCYNLTIYASENSYAIKYAKEKKIPYQVI